MPTKLVVTSDTHIHDWKAFGGESGFGNVRLQQTLKVVEDSLKKAKEIGAAWVHAGDIIHTTGYGKHPISAAVINLLSKYPEVPKVMVWGNHDSRGRGGRICLEESFQHTIAKSVDNVHILDRSTFEFEDIVIYGCGAQPDISLLEHAEADVGVFHQMVKGAKLQSGITISSGIPQQDLYDHYTLSIVGDIHVPHLQEKDGNFIMIPGAPEQHNFGDKGDRGWYVVEFADGVPEFESFVSDSPKFITVDDPSEIKDDGNFYRVMGTTDSGDVPANAKFIGPSKDVVERRNVLSSKDDTLSILKKWLELNPPEDGDTDRFLSVAQKLLSEQDIIVPEDHKLLRVKGEDFCSYEEFFYDIQEGVTLVLGTSDRFDSNGSGKSTLFEAIFWCLFGKTTKGLGATDVVRRGKKKCSVTLEIELVDGRTLVLTRERTPALALSATIDGAEVSADTNRDLQDKILGVLGLNEKLFLSLAYFSQQDVTLLSEATDAEIKEIMSDLAGNSGYQEAASEANKTASSLENTRDKISVVIEQKQEELEQKKQSVENIKTKISEWEDKHKIDVSSCEQSILKKERVLVRYKDYDIDPLKSKAKSLYQRAKKRKEDVYSSVFDAEFSRKLEVKKESLTELKNQFSTFTEPTQTVEEYKEKISEENKRLQTLNDKISEAKTKKYSIRSDLRHNQTKLRQLENNLNEFSSGVCPECGQDVPVDEDLETNIKSDIEETSSEIENLETRLGKAERFLSKAEDKKSQLCDSIESLEKKKSNAKKYNDLKIKLEEKSENIEESAKSEAEIIANNKAESYLEGRKSVLTNRVKRAERFLENKVSTIKKEISNLEDELARIKKAENPHREYLDSTKADIDKIESKISSEQDKKKDTIQLIKIYKYWSDGFGKSGIQSLLMDEIASEFNRVRSRIFPTLTNGYYDVQFSTLSETQSGELREKLSFLVFDEGQQVPYESLSGGQRRRVDVGVLLTMTAAICASYGISGVLGIMILDEVTDALDENGAESVADTLNEYVDFAVPSVYLISHSTALQSLFSQHMLVEHKDKVSRIV